MFFLTYSLILESHWCIAYLYILVLYIYITVGTQIIILAFSKYEGKK